MRDLEWIRESNLIEDVDDDEADRDALEGWVWLQIQSLEIDTILTLHEMMLRHLDPAIAGVFRRVNVTVGGFRPPIWQDVEERMREWVHTYRLYPVLSEEVIRESHIQFEKIHPFEDGNGRVGRMLMNWFRVSRGLDPLLIKASERADYYEWFR